MEDPTNIVLSGSRIQEFGKAMHAVLPLLPKDTRERFLKAFKAYLFRYGTKGLFERLNNRTIASIIAESDSVELPTPTHSSEKDGVRWALYDPPAERPHAEGGKSDG
jgi:hypothetical protein